MEDSLKKHIDFYESFVDQVRQGHIESKQCRDYVNHIQYTADERRDIEARGQPVVTDNRIGQKNDYFLGIERQTRTDPKAFPRTPKHEKDSESITDLLRYACDKGEWDANRSEAFDNLIVEGMEGYSITVKQQPNGDIDIFPRHIPWDRIVYDHYSTDRYFDDSKRKGVVIWMDEEDALLMFPGKKDVIEAALNGNDEEDDVFQDKPSEIKWSDKARRRLKAVQLYELNKGVWKHQIFTKSGYLTEPEVSKYHDEYGQPSCPIELGSAYIDKDNDRFGLVRRMISLQDMVNKMLSKYTHFINTNQTWGNAAGPDPTEAKKQANMPNGHFSLEGKGKFGEDFGIVQNDNKAMGTFNVLQQAIQALSEIGGSSIVDDQVSGRAKEITQQSKLMELGPVLDTHRQLSKRVYKQIHNRARQFWTEEKWIRVTDNEDSGKYKFTQLNKRSTYRELLMEKYGQIPESAQFHPGLDNEVITNNIAEIDVDIIIEESVDVINLQAEQFQIIARLAETYGPQEVPFEEVLKLSSLRNKEGFIERTKGTDEQKQQMQEQQQAKQQEAEQLQQQAFVTEMSAKEAKKALDEAKTIKTREEAEKVRQETEKIDIETELLVMDRENPVVTTGSPIAGQPFR